MTAKTKRCAPTPPHNHKKKREPIADQIGSALALTQPFRWKVADVIRRNAKCYAGLLGTMRTGRKGYADAFERPKLYPGRVAEAAQWASPSATEIADKPWLASLPRLIFVSDMGDALSENVPFEYLQQERPSRSSNSWWRLNSSRQDNRTRQAI